MKILKFFLIALGVFIGIILILGLFVGKDYTVERSIVILKPKELILPELTNLKNVHDWSPWTEYDPNMKINFQGTDGTVGSFYTWEGNKKVGNGKQEIVLISDTLVESKLIFYEPWESECRAYFKLQPEGNGYKTTWGMKGKNAYPMNVMCLFMNMDKMVGKEFEKGLSNLKEKVEKKN